MPHRDPSLSCQHIRVSAPSRSHCPFQLGLRKGVWGQRRRRGAKGRQIWLGSIVPSHLPLFPSAWPSYTALSEAQASQSEVAELGIHKEPNGDFLWQEHKALGPHRHRKPRSSAFNNHKGGRIKTQYGVTGDPPEISNILGASRLCPWC